MAKLSFQNGEIKTLPDILAWRIPWTEEPGGYSPWGCKESDTTNAHAHKKTKTDYH